MLCFYICNWGVPNQNEPGDSEPMYLIQEANLAAKICWVSIGTGRQVSSISLQCFIATYIGANDIWNSRNVAIDQPVAASLEEAASYLQ